MNYEEIFRLYERKIPSTRTGLFYNLFSYPTKISPEVIAVYIATHTSKGATILDAFGGSGTTAVAAKLCEHPNSVMLDLAKELYMEPEWGPRNTVTYEIGKYGYFAADTLMHAPDPDQFARDASDFIKEAGEQLETYYQTTDDEGKEGCIRHIVWSDIVLCPACRQEISYYDVAVDVEPFSIKKEGACPLCGENISLEDCEHVTIKQYDALLKKNITARKRVPKKIYGVTGKRRWSRMATGEDLEQCNRMGLYLGYEPKEIVWGDLYRSGYHQGITHLHHFYTERNYFVMANLWKMTEAYEASVKNALRLLLLSYNASHATLMTRVVAKKNSKDFVLTGAQSGVLYISNMPVEKNIILGIKRKIKSFTEAFALLNTCTGTAQVFNGSSENMRQVRSGSVDYVFTDPPFGDYIPYAEVNQINELWLGDVTDRRDEAIISRAQKKDVEDYRQKLSAIFREIQRVLKEDGLATVVFHSAKAEVWNVLCRAVVDAGMSVKTASVLDKLQGSFKQVTEGVSVKGDPIMLLSKGHAVWQKNISLRDIVLDHVGTGEVDEESIYSEYISYCLTNNQDIHLDAKEAYQMIRQMAEVI